jgi:hypothetical protein
MLFSQLSVPLARAGDPQHPVGVTDDYKKQQELQKKNAMTAYYADLTAAIGYGIAGALCVVAYTLQYTSAKADVSWCRETGKSAQTMTNSMTSDGAGIVAQAQAAAARVGTAAGTYDAVAGSLVAVNAAKAGTCTADCAGATIGVAACAAACATACTVPYVDVIALNGAQGVPNATMQKHIGTLEENAVKIADAIVLMNKAANANSAQCEAVIRGGSEAGKATADRGTIAGADAKADGAAGKGGDAAKDASCPAEGPGYATIIDSLAEGEAAAVTLQTSLGLLGKDIGVLQTAAALNHVKSEAGFTGFNAVSATCNYASTRAGVEAWGGTIKADQSPAALADTAATDLLNTYSRLNLACTPPKVGACALAHENTGKATAAKSMKIAAEDMRLACEIAGYASKGVDVAGAVYIAIQTKDATKVVLPLTTIVAQLGLELMMSDGGKPSKIDGEGCQLGAMSFIGNFLQSAVRSANAIMAKNQADDADKDMAEMKGGTTFNAQPNQLAGNTNNQGDSQSGTTGAVGGVSRNTGGGLTPAQQKTSDKIASSLATGAFGTTSKAFEKLTGVSGKQLADAVASGVKPLEAVAQAATAAGQMDSDIAAKAVAISQNEGKLNDAMAQAKIPLSDTGFESTPMASKGGGGGGGDNDMANMMGAMMGMLNPQKGAAGPHGPAPAAPAPVAKPVQTSDGFHLPDKSLFEVVGLRYQIVANDFLNGKTITHEGQQQQAPSLVPSNPYLKKH